MPVLQREEKYLAGGGTSMARYVYNPDQSRERFHCNIFFFFFFLLMEGFLALYAQLGLGDCIDRNIPSPVSIGGCQLKNVACGWWHTLLLATTSTKLVKENRDEEQFC